LLSENLEHELLTPQSVEWRDSLFALGKACHTQGIRIELQARMALASANDPATIKSLHKQLKQSSKAFQEAIYRLSEAVHRYPKVKQSIQARYWIADANRHIARLLMTELDMITIKTIRVELNRKIAKRFDAALSAYSELEVLLDDKQDETELPEDEKAILRNCSFIRGSVLSDLGRYKEAIDAFSTATSRNQHKPESLEAFVQIAACYRHLNRPIDARGTIAQAKDVLKRIHSDKAFLQTTRYSRREWEQLLDWLGKL
jgi:tetratricopeptide (TPR) repeat protein